MDALPDWATQYLATHAHHLHPYANQAHAYLSTAKAHLTPLLTAKPDLATLALLLLILFLSLKLLNMLWQTLLFWLRMARRVVLWAGLLVLGMWVYNRGVEGVAEDLGGWWGVWRGELEFWRERERSVRAARLGGGGKGAAGGGGWFS